MGSGLFENSRELTKVASLGCEGQHKVKEGPKRGERVSCFAEEKCWAEGP